MIMHRLTLTATERTELLDKVQKGNTVAKSARTLLQSLNIRSTSNGSVGVV